MPAYLIQGMSLGDEGKGSVVDALVRLVDSDLVVRFNGGAQAAHNVITPEAQHHTFSQFGSGSFVPGVRTFLSRFVLVNPISMMIEEKELSAQGVSDTWNRMGIDTRCLVITPFQRAYNRILEISRADGRHGSTGMGIGQCREDSLSFGERCLMINDLLNPDITREKLTWQRSLYIKRVSGKIWPINRTIQRELDALYSPTIVEWYVDKYSEFISKVTLRQGMPESFNNPVFEGAQGVLLDETYGLQPHTTWTDCTFNNANTILNEANYKDKRYKIGVWRSYLTRHGAGPLPNENSGKFNSCPELHNKKDQYTGSFRAAEFSFPLAVYANKVVGGVDGFIVNHLDTHPWGGKYLLETLEQLLTAPCIGKGTGHTYKDKSINLGALDAKVSDVKWAFGLGKIHDRQGNASD